MIRLQFVRGTGFSSGVIAWTSFGLFSHVDAVLHDGQLLGSRSDRVGGKPPGVQIRRAGYEKWRHRVVLELPAHPVQVRRFEDFLFEQIDRPYDHLAIVAFGIARNWRTEGAWFCSELLAAALEAAEVCPKLYTPSCKVTPVCLSTVFSALGAKVVKSD